MVFIVFVLSNALIAQIRISGKVMTLDNIPLEYAEVSLFSKDSQPLISRLTNERGEFNMEYQKGSYKLEIRQFKQIVHSRQIELDSAFEAGVITVDAANNLGAVEITNKRKIVERKIDRLVFNIENTISSVGGDALDALKITPGVLVRNESVSIIGKQSIRVMIDDKMLELGEEGLANFLRSIPADQIKSIEVITSPPAQYDAAGGSGLINIKLKKAQMDSWSLSLGSSYLRRIEDGEGAVTSNFMYNKNNLSLTTSLNYRKGGETYSYEDYMTFPDQLWNTKQSFNRNYKRLNGIFGLQYIACPKWSFGFQYITNLNKTMAQRFTRSLVYEGNNDLPFNEILADNRAAQKPDFHSVNLFNEIKLDSAGSKVMLNLDYFNYANNDTRPYEGTSALNNPQGIQYFRGINNNIQRTDNFSGKLDVELPSKLANWSFGGKLSVLNTGNDISAFNSGLVDQPITNMPQADYKFDYSEYLQAIYVSGNKRIMEKLEAQIGLRMESTQTKSLDGNLQQSFNNNYTKLFPSLNLSFSATENSTYRLSYGKRIARPNFSELNPNVTFITPFLTVEGNPVLQPYFIDNFEFIYSYKKLDSKLYYSAESNVFNQIGLPDLNTNNIRLIYQNIYNIKRYGFSETFVFDKLDWWTSNTLFDMHYITSETINLAAKGIDGFNSYFLTNNDFNLNRSKTVLFNFNFGYSFGGTYGIDKVKPSSSTSVAVQYLLLNKDLRITLKANDIFKTDRYQFNSTLNGVHRNSNYYFDSRIVQLSLNYKFGNKKVSVQKRQTASEDERARTGN